MRGEPTAAAGFQPAAAWRRASYQERVQARVKVS